MQYVSVFSSYTIYVLSVQCIGQVNCLPKVKFNGSVHLRNEFHFSGVHGAMNRSGSRAK